MHTNIRNVPIVLMTRWYIFPWFSQSSLQKRTTFSKYPRVKNPCVVYIYIYMYEADQSAGMSQFFFCHVVSINNSMGKKQLEHLSRLIIAISYH
jgi:hypothetical protein